jgi:TolB-like protein
MRPVICLLLLVACGFVTACGPMNLQPTPDNRVDLEAAWDGTDKNWNDNLVSGSYYLADNLVFDLRRKQRESQLTGPLLIASFVNVDNLEESSTAGRLLSEHIASRLAQHGYQVIEMKLNQKSIFVKKEMGEFLLSRDIKEISKTNNAVAVIVGTYGIADNRIYVTARVVRTLDSVILAASDAGFPVILSRKQDLFKSQIKTPTSK